MPQTPATEDLGTGGWLGLLAACIALLIRLLKTDTLDAALAKLSIPPIPKKALPWIAIVAGFGAGFIEAMIGGLAPDKAAIAGFWALFAGALSITGNETLSTPTRAVSPALADVLFGKGSGPNPGPAANQPSLRPPPDNKPPTPPVTAVSGLMLMAIAVVLAFAAPGCTAFRSVLPKVIAAVGDSAMVLDEIDNFVDMWFKVHPDGAKELEVNKGIAKARTALVIAQRSLSGVENIDQGQIDKAFADFATAYQELIALLEPLGVRTSASGPGGEGTLALGDSGVVIPTPAVLTLRVREDQ